MDAMRLAFSDSCFDAAVAPYVLTVVPDPAATLDELMRVVKPGGEIVLVNHVGAESGPIAAIEAWLGRRSAALGWRPQFPWAIIADWIAARSNAVSSSAAPSRRSVCLLWRGSYARLEPARRAAWALRLVMQRSALAGVLPR